MRQEGQGGVEASWGRQEEQGGHKEHGPFRDPGGARMIQTHFSFSSGSRQGPVRLQVKCYLFPILKQVCSLLLRPPLASLPPPFLPRATVLFAKFNATF